MRQLIRADTQEAITIAGPALPDGRVLVQHVSNGTLDVIDVKQLQVVDKQQDGAR